MVVGRVVHELRARGLPARDAGGDRLRADPDARRSRPRAPCCSWSSTAPRGRVAGVAAGRSCRWGCWCLHPRIFGPASAWVLRQGAGGSRCRGCSPRGRLGAPARLVRPHGRPARRGRLAAGALGGRPGGRAARPSWAWRSWSRSRSRRWRSSSPRASGCGRGPSRSRWPRTCRRAWRWPLSVGTRLVLTLVELVFIAAVVLVDRHRPVSVAAPVRRPRPRPGAAWAARRPRAPQAAVWAMMAACTPRSSRSCPSSASGRSGPGGSTSGTWSRRSGARPRAGRSRPPTSSGEQFSRLGAHVDPILVLFTPLAWTPVLPEAPAGGPGRDRGRRRAPGLLAGPALAGRRPPGGGRRGRLPALPAPPVGDADRVPPGHPRRAAADVLHLGRRGAPLRPAVGPRGARPR